MTQAERNKSSKQVPPKPTPCDEYSNRSRPTTPGEEYCSTCNSSYTDTSSYTCDHSADCHCSIDQHSDDQSSSSNHHHRGHYHRHHGNKAYHNPSWKEDMKLPSMLDDSNSSTSCHSNRRHHNMQYNVHRNMHHKSRGFYPEDLHINYNNPALPTSTTMKSLQSSNKVIDNKSHKRRFCCCFCCCCCRTRTHSRLVVFFVFFLCILGAFAAFFSWPRTPRVSMGGGADSLSGSPDWWGGEKQPLPSADAPIPARPSLRATWQINVTLDNRDNWIPTRLNQLDFVMVDSLTLAKFAWATTSGPLLLPPGIITPISLTFNVNYQAADRTDPTFQNLYNACGTVNGSKQRPALNVILRVSFHIFGIMWTPLVTATPYTGGILCPTK